MESPRALRTRALALSLAVTGVVTLASFGGCAGPEKTSAGEVPEGYSSWEEYSKAQDRMQMEIERARRTNPPRTGIPR